MPKINQILAIEKNKKTTLHKEITELHRQTQQPTIMTGHTKTFVPKEDDGETYPPEDRKVQLLHQDALDDLCDRLAALMDVTAAKDWSNCKARADVVIGNETFLEQVPVTYLLFLEKELIDLQTFVSKMVELDPALHWTFDENSGQYRSDSTTTHKTKKLQRPIVLYPHVDGKEGAPGIPAQTQLITEDVVIGHWTTTNFSGAIPRPKKRQLLERIQELHDAVKFAREHANSLDAEEPRIGKKILARIFKEDAA
jgi:hypothetical protein